MTYRTPLKGMIVQALKGTFDDTYPSSTIKPEVSFAGVHVSIEYPADQANYPGIWVDYDDTAPLVKAGVDHEEIVNNEADEPTRVTRWRFEGYISMTVTALTSLERDLLFDDLVSIIAFAKQDPIRGRFVSMAENNDYIACNIDTDTITSRGSVAAPGTPWGTDEVVYEASINLNVIGEFVPNPDNSEALLLLSEIIVVATNVYDEPEYSDLVARAKGFGPVDWH